MKDKDFEEMGKRLYDLEADPPKNGWNKIRPMILPEKPAGKMVWLRKHWWKPLFLIIPAALYWLYPTDTATPAAEIAPIVESITAPATEEKNETQNKADKNSTTTIDSQNELVLSDNTKSISASTKKPSDTSNKKVIIAHTVTSKITSPATNEPEKLTSIAPHQSTSILNTTANQATTLAETSETLVGKNETSQKTSETKETALIQQDSTMVKTSAQKETPVANITIKDNSTAPFMIAAEQKNDRNETVRQTKKSVAASASALDSAAATKVDSVIVEKTIKIDSAVNPLAKEEDQKKVTSTWRITAAITPQYETKTVRPLINDEILVTGVNNTLQPQRIGLGVALGIGKSITPNFYIDGQLSFHTTQQNVNFSYSTGIVDTLIAVQQADQSVIVTPILEANYREISSRYNYGGLRLLGTYYFWTAPRRRFNVTAGAGAQYLLSASVREKINNQWVSLGNNDLNKINYSLVVGAGYNKTLSKGWEVMVNPTLTYYLREVKNPSLPYNLNQRSFGMTVMISKTLSH